MHPRQASLHESLNIAHKMSISSVPYPCSHPSQICSFSLASNMAFTQLKTLLFTLLCVISVSTACAQEEPCNETDYVARNLQTVQKIYNLTVYPKNLPIQKNGSSAVPPGLFNQDATGRVSPIGNFSGFADSIEYFFALAPSPENFNGLAFYAADVVEFTSGCPEVASSVVYLRTHTLDPKTGKVDESKKTSTLAQVRRSYERRKSGKC